MTKYSKLKGIFLHGLKFPAVTPSALNTVIIFALFKLADCATCKAVTSANKAHWKEIGQLAETQGFHWGGNGGDSLFQKYTDANYGTGWNKNYFEFRDCGQRRGAKKYWSREKDADQWFELGCVPE